jgi:anti-sigma factor RsiW
VVCDDNGRWLHGYLDGELDLVRSLEIEEHLKACADCAQELRSQQTLRKAFRAPGLYDRAPQGLEARIRASISREADGAEAGPATPGGPSAAHGAVPGEAPRKADVVIMPTTPRRAALNWLAIAAAILLAALLGWRVVPGERGTSQDELLAQEIVASHIRSLQPGHLMDVESTDQHTVKPWFNGKLDFSPQVKDFAADGFPLVGGRLDYAAHRDVAALVYQRRQHLINVYEWPDDSGAERPVRAKSSQGYNMLLWQRGGMYFCAVSDLNSSELRQFIQLFQQ